MHKQTPQIIRYQIHCRFPGLCGFQPAHAGQYQGAGAAGILRSGDIGLQPVADDQRLCRG